MVTVKVVPHSEWETNVEELVRDDWVIESTPKVEQALKKGEYEHSSHITQQKMLYALMVTKWYLNN